MAAPLSDSSDEFDGFDEYDGDLARERANVSKQRLEHYASDIEISSSESDSATSSAQSDDSDHVPGNHEWSNVLSDLQCNVFIGDVPGPKTTVPETATELDFLNLIFSDTLYEHIARETNKYARAKIATKPDPKWRNVTASEIKAYLGAQIVGGVVPVPKKLFFTKDSLMHCTGLSQKV